MARLSKSDVTYMRIKRIEKEIRDTPYHKGTEHHIGKLRARLAVLRDKEMSAPLRQGSGGAPGFALRKQGDATVVLVGPPSVGKSTLLNALTNAESKVAPYAFTTVSVIPGMMKYKDAYIQILDVPGLIEGAQKGKGRGKEVLSVARGADLILIMVETDRIEHLDKIVSELEKAGIRINEERPQVAIKKTLSGGLVIHSNIKQGLDKEIIKEVAQEFGIKNAEIKIKESLGMETLIDAFSTSRVYVPAIFIVNKIDQAKNLHYNNIYQYSDIVKISAKEGIGIEKLQETIWRKLGLIRVYLVRPGEEPSFKNPIIMKSGQILGDVARKIGTEFSHDVKSAKIWGPGSKFPGQEVSLSTLIQEGIQVQFLH